MNNKIMNNKIMNNNNSPDKILLTILKIGIPAIILLWIIIEYYDYVPKENNRKLIKINNENFTDKIESRYRPIPNPSNDEFALSNKMDTSILRSSSFNPNVVLSKYYELDYYQMNYIVNRILKKNNNNISDNTKNILGNLKPIITDQKSIDSDDKPKIKSYKLSNNLEDEKELHQLNIKYVLASISASINKEVLVHQKDYNEKSNNEKSKKSKLNMLSPYHKFEPFTLRNYQIINYYNFKEFYQSQPSIISRYILDIRIGRDHKPRQFTFQVDALVVNSNSNDINDKVILISSFHLTGMPTERILDNKKKIEEKLEEKLGTNISNMTHFAMDFKSQSTQKIVPETEMIEELLLERKEKGVYSAIDQDAKCFHPKGEGGELPLYGDELKCKSYHSEVNGVGVWDAPCQENKDCPFYKSNANYPNSFGKCLPSGKCEMPIGIERIGFKNYYKMTKPLCHNCKNIKNGEDNNCCQYQKDKIKAKNTNTNTNTNMVSPDYMFVGDTKVRNQYSSYLQDKGLSVNTKI